LRQDRTDTRAIHFFVDFLAEIFFRRVRECTTTSTPDRGRRHTGTSAPGAFLAPWFFRAVLDLFAIFLGAITGTCVCLIGNHDLVNQRFVEITTEDCVRCADGCVRLTLIVQELKIHYLAPFADILMAGRTTTSPFL